MAYFSPIPLLPEEGIQEQMTAHFKDFQEGEEMAFLDVLDFSEGKNP